jgi:hypothetical protein
MIIMYKLKLVLFGLVAFMLASCREAAFKPDIENIKNELVVLRFEKDLFNTDFDKFNDSIAFFKSKYGEFFELFNYKIIKVGNCSNPAYPSLIKGFLTDYNMNKLKATVDSSFIDFSSTEANLRTMFKYYKYYFPKNKLPKVITYISGFNQSIVTTDTLLGIGLDKYLGQSSSYYAMLGLPLYMRLNMAPYRIPADCAAAWCITQFPMSDSALNMLSVMIYKGKVAYFSKMLLPDSPDSLVLAMSSQQVEWCKVNEKQMWQFLIENKLLFKNDFMIIKKFTEEAPFTKEFGRNSPGKAVIWCGYQIVKSFMNNKKETTLKGLMSENDCQRILRISKYRP